MDNKTFNEMKETIRKQGERPGKELFDEMVKRGAIDEQGNVLLRSPKMPGEGESMSEDLYRHVQALQAQRDALSIEGRYYNPDQVADRGKLDLAIASLFYNSFPFIQGFLVYGYSLTPEGQDGPLTFLASFLDRKIAETYCKEIMALGAYNQVYVDGDVPIINDLEKFKNRQDFEVIQLSPSSD